MLGDPCCNHLAQLCYSGEQLWFIGSFELAVLLALVVEVELGNRGNLESLGTIATVLSVYSAELEVVIIICTSKVFKDWLDSDAWRAGGAPEVYCKCRGLLNELVQLGQVLDLNGSLSIRLLLGSTV